MADGILKFDDVKWCTYRLDAIVSCRPHAVLVEYGVMYVEHEAEHLSLGHACGTQHSEFAGGKEEESGGPPIQRKQLQVETPGTPRFVYST